MDERLFRRAVRGHVHILDADPGTCEALSLLFRLEGYQTGFSLETESYQAALARRRPDIVIINARIGNADGVAVLRRTRATRLGLPVIMLQDRPRVETAVAAIKAGATDVVTKPVDTEHLVGLVRETLRGQRRGAGVPRRRPLDLAAFGELTRREREVLELITDGRSNKESGQHLGISPRTIEVHRARVMEKLGARNTADLMRIVLSG